MDLDTRRDKEIIDILNARGDEQDPLADELVKKMIGDRTLYRVHALFSELEENGDQLPPDAPPLGREFFERTGKLPSWYDAETALRGARAYSNFGPECMVVLLFRSLPEGYTMWHVARTLATTGRLEDHDGNTEKLQRRILETLQFLVHVMTPHGFEEGGAATMTAQKVKMIHATVRAKIVDANWDAAWAPPLNQEEILMTMLTFSLIVVRGLRRLGIRHTTEEREAILHLWKVVAHLLGLEDELQPRNWKEAERMWTIVVARHRTKPTEDGVRLSDSVVAYGDAVLEGHLSFLPPLLLRYLNQRDVIRRLEMPRPPVLSYLFMIPVRGFLGALSFLATLSPLARFAQRRFNLWFIRKLVLHWNKNREVNFMIPTTLQGEWNLSEFYERNPDLKPRPKRAERPPQAAE